MSERSPRVPPWVSIHAQACEAGDATYRDPQSGAQVFTAVGLMAEGRCCGSDCRHCPYGDADTGTGRVVDDASDPIVTEGRSVRDRRSRVTAGPRPMKWVWIALAVMGGLYMVCSGPKEVATGLSETCTEVGARCLHSAGKVGLCTISTERPCASPHCLVCASQH